MQEEEEEVEVPRHIAKKKKKTRTNIFIDDIAEVSEDEEDEDEVGGLAGLAGGENYGRGHGGALVWQLGLGAMAACGAALAVRTAADWWAASAQARQGKLLWSTGLCAAHAGGSPPQTEDSQYLAPLSPRPCIPQLNTPLLPACLQDEEGMDDLIDDEGGEALNAADMVEMRRQMREAELQAAKDNEINPEDIQRLVDQRYGNRDYSLGRGGEEGESSAVTQQALLPRANDPKLWVVRCAEGAERELVVSLLQKCYDYEARGTPLMIKSAFCQDHLKG